MSSATGTTIPAIPEQSGLMGSIFLQDLQQKLAVQRAAYAEACGQTIPAQGSGINFTTVHNHPPPQPPIQTSPAQQSPPQKSGLLKGALLGGAVIAGLAGMGGLGYFAGGLLNKPTPAKGQSYDSNVHMEVIPPQKGSQ